jgi:predicted phosphodiesterase
MIYITGDTHADSKRFKKFKGFFGRRHDYCVVCGDFGFVWNASATEKRKLAGLSHLRCNVLFVEGTHDNLELLSQYPLVEYKGGMARQLAKNIFWLRRGDIFDLDGTTLFAFGGGESDDADERLPLGFWWPQELPDEAEIARARQNLQNAQMRVDIIVTHKHPGLRLGLIDPSKDRIDILTAFLGQVARTVQFDHWYFGGQHMDREISAKMTAVFESVLRHDSGKPGRKAKRKSGRAHTRT